MAYGDESHAQAYRSKILARIGTRPGQAATEWALSSMGFFQLLAAYGPLSAWRISPPPPAAPDQGQEPATEVQRRRYIDALVATHPDRYTLEGLATCSLTTLEAELGFYATWYQCAREVLAEPWRPPAVTTRAALAPPTGPVEHLKIPPLRRHTPASDDWRPPAIALQQR